MHLAIRADGGPDIGYGHLVRTGTLAARARRDGHAVTYCTRTVGPARSAVPASVDLVDIGEDRPHESFLGWLDDHAVDVVLADSYEVDTERQRAIARRVPRTVVVLDDTRFAVRADVLVNGNVYAPDLEYEWVGPEPKWCLGTEYLLLREAVRSLVAREPPDRDPPERAVVTMGGSDIRNATPGAVRAFDGVDLTVDVIVGPGFDNRAEIHRAVAGTDARFEVVEDPADLAERMLRADLAVSATGTTVYELLALGTPTVGVPQADNQEPIVDALDRRGAVLPVREGGADTIGAGIRSLVAEPDLRRRLRERGRALIDGGGVDRVYRTVREGTCAPS